MNEQKLILVVGPPGCGKDTFCGMIAERVHGARVEKMATHLKMLTHRLYGLDLPTNAFEGMKDEASDAFWGATAREAYIQLSEGYFKPLYGVEYFGRYLRDRFRLDTSSRYFIISDSGFEEEAKPLIEHFKPENVIQVRLKRAGCTFKLDSRRFWSPPKGVLVQTIQNDGPITQLAEEVNAFVDFLKDQDRKDE